MNKRLKILHTIVDGRQSLKENLSTVLHTKWDRETGRDAARGAIIRTGAKGVTVPVASSGNGTLPESSFPRAIAPVLVTRSWAAGRPVKCSELLE